MVIKNNAMNESKKTYNKFYYQKNRDRLIASARLYWKNHKEQISGKRKAQYQLNRETILAEKKQYHQQNSERIRAYCQENKERRNAQSKAYHVANKDRLNEAHKLRRSANPEIARIYNRKRRCLKYGCGHEPYPNQYIFERDAWECGICGRKINKRLKHPDPLSGSIDHIIPLSKGGNDSLLNVQAAHLRCNLGKNAALCGQLRLIG